MFTSYGKSKPVMTIRQMHGTGYVSNYTLHGINFRILVLKELT